MKKLVQGNDLQRTRFNRYFSEDFKKQKVQEIEHHLTSISEVCKTYEVSRTSVYRWIYKYSLNLKRGTKQVIEAMSDTKKIKELEKRIKELEQLVGQQQMIIQVNEKMIDLAEDYYNIKIKKNSGSKPSTTSGKTSKKRSSR